MGRQILLLRLEGPLQSWGIRSRWDVRDTQTEPTKSGIVGLLGCALGYPMGDMRLETELDAGFRFGVRVESPGTILQDYQTITDFLPTAAGEYKARDEKRKKTLAAMRADPDAIPATIISPRFYLEDAAFLVALEERPGFAGLAQRSADALKSPVWPLFLGRKACIPTRPIFERLTEEYERLEDALNAHPWSWLQGRGEMRKATEKRRLPIFWEPEGNGFGQPGTTTRQDAVRINPARQYGFRMQCRGAVEISGLLPQKGEA